MSLRRVLLVSYQFPPMGGSGVQRALKLAAHLPVTGWEAEVLTAGHRHYPLMDATLEDRRVPASRVHRVRGWEPGALAAALSRQFTRHSDVQAHEEGGFEDRLYWRLDSLAVKLRLPEMELLWVPAAVRKARGLVQRLGLSAVVTTSPPHASHLVGMTVRRRLGIPWIADLRDPIVDNFAYAPPSRLADRFWRWIERSILAKADHVIVTCPELEDRLSRRFGANLASRISTITNGYDPADMVLTSPSRNGGHFVMSHVGAFYREQSIGPVLEAIRHLRERRADIADKLRLRLVGSVSASQRSLLRDSDDAFIEWAGYCSHAAAIEEMAEADVLFVMTPANDGGRLCIPAKVFEYLAFGRHILGLVHADTHLSQLLAESGNTTLVTDRNPAALKEAIEHCFDNWTSGQLNTPRDRRVVDRHRRDRLAVEYARVIEHCVDGGPMLRVSSEECEEVAA